MDSQVVKDLQKLHFKDRIIGLEDVFQLQPESCGLGTKAPVSPRHLSFLGANLTESVNLKDRKDKARASDGYYYKSPCPEKQKSHNCSPVRKPQPTSFRLIEKAAEFCKENEVDGFASKVFVGNISYKVKDGELREFFSYFGKVIRANVCRDSKSKRSRGYGFVIFSSREEAEAAINGEDYQLTLDGRLMKVKWAERRRKAKDCSGLPDGQCLKDLAISLLETESLPDLEPIEDLEKSSDAFMDQLNDDILMHIFAYLELKERIRIERVCRRWRNLSLQSWKVLTNLSFKGMFKAFEGTGGLTDKILYSILRKGCTNLHSLDLSSSPYFLTPHGIFVIGKICTELRSLNLSGVAVNNNNLKDLGKRCKLLETLVLGRCRDFGEKGLWWFLKEVENLKHLEVTDNVRINGKCFWMLRESCKEVILTDSVKISDFALENISKRSPKIEVLDIRNCLLLSDVGLAKICEECTSLRKLVFTGAGPGITAQGMMSIHSLQNLEYLDISQNQIISDEVIQCLIHSCKNLQYLNLEACHGTVTDDGIKSLSNLPNLKELNISYLAEITDSSIEHLSANSNLRKILCRACSKLTNEALISLLLFSGDSLTEIDFSGCFLVDDKLIDNERLPLRDELCPKVNINIGGTSVSPEGAVSLQNKIERCVISLEKKYSSRFRDDFDPTSCPPFYSSDEEDDDDKIEDGSHFHSYSSEGYKVRSSDLQDQSYNDATQTIDNDTVMYDDYDSMNERGYGYGFTDDQIDDFFDADDPALMNELEEQFMFN